MLTFIIAGCGRCGYRCRAVASKGVAAAYPDRAAWTRRCRHRPAAAHPLSCADLAKAIAAAAARTEQVVVSWSWPPRR